MICNQSNEVGKNNIKSKCYFCCFVQIKFIENSVNACQSSMECCPSLWSTFEMHHAYIAAGWVWSKNMKMMPQLILINCIKLLTLEHLCVGNLTQHWLITDVVIAIIIIIIRCVSRESLGSKKFANTSPGIFLELGINLARHLQHRPTTTVKALWFMKPFLSMGLNLWKIQFYVLMHSKWRL